MATAMRDHPLATSIEDRPTMASTQHLHRGGLLVLTPADQHRPIPMTWLTDRSYRIAFDPARSRWHLQVEDDLRWATVARVVTAPSGTDYLDVAATPDGTPVLCRHDTYLIGHHDGHAGCRMTITPLRA